MLRKLISYIFICILLIGCEYENPLTSECESDFEMDVVSDLVMDENGYYNMSFISGEIQTFAVLSAEIGLQYWPVGWISNKEYNIEHMGTDNWTNLINQSSYSDDDGTANTVLGVWPEFIGDTIKVYCGYHDECDFYFLDSLEVIVK